MPTLITQQSIIPIYGSAANDIEFVGKNGSGLENATAQVVFHSNNGANQVSVALTADAGNTATDVKFTGTLTPANKVTLLGGYTTRYGLTVPVGWQLTITPSGGSPKAGLKNNNNFIGSFTLEDNRLPTTS